jgi:tight adherence protein B
MNLRDTAINPYLAFVSVACFCLVLFWLLLRLVQKLRPQRRELVANGIRLKDRFDESPSSVDRSLERLMEQSGIPMRSDAYTVLATGISLVVGGIVLVLADDLVLSLLSALSTLCLMGMFVLVMRSRRRSKVQAEVPVAIELIARALQAGDGLEKSLLITSQRLQGPLKQDLGWCANQLRMGLPMNKALQQLDDRNELFELRIFNSALTINRDTGGDLANTLDRLARVLYDRQEYRRHLAMTTATASFAAMIIGFVGPGLLVYYAFQQDYLGGLWQDRSAQFYMMLASGFEVVGILWLFAITRSEL